MINENRNRGWLASIAQALGWLATAAGAIVDLLAIREAILSLLAIFSVAQAAAYHRAGGVGTDLVTQFGLTAFDNFVLFTLGIVVVGVVIWLEYYFRKGREIGLLYKRLGRVALIEVIIVVASVLVRFIASLVLQSMA